MSLPRGIRNFNPANIVRTADKWIGQADSQPDPRFVSFTTPEFGIRALMVILLRYERAYKLTNVAKIIARFAPEVENDTQAYIQAVAQHLGVNPHADIAPFTQDTLCGLAEAIAGHECGHCPDPTLPYWFPKETYEKAYNMATTHEVPNA
jgi:hypothetical protein